MAKFITPEQAEQTQKSAAELLTFVLNERRRFADEGLLEANKAHRRHFYYLCNGILWMHSEAYGKYDGCRHWTEKARAFRISQGENSVLTSKDKYGGNALRHEHVYTRKKLINDLFDRFDKKEAEVEDVQALLNKYNLACVVTLKEHRELNKHRPTPEPWNRYNQAGVKWEEWNQRS